MHCRRRFNSTIYRAHTRQTHFSACDLDLDPMTLIHELGLDIVKMYPRTEKEVFRSRLSEVIGQTRQTDRQTDRRDWTHYYATLVVMLM